MIITIDGPAGSGKSTAARKLAARLQIAYLDTGAMYRAIANTALGRGTNLDDEAALATIARTVDLELDCGPTHTRVRVDGNDVTECIRTMAVSAATPFVAKANGVREVLVARQREIGRSLGSFVSEGRDQGSIVFPDADAKFVLEASLQKRAERRLHDMLADGEEARIEAVLDNLRTRDKVDAKQWEPLLASGNAVVIDTSHLSITAVTDRMVAVVTEVARGGKASC